MFRNIHRSQAGLALPLIIAVIVVIAGVGGAGYYVYSKQADKKSSSHNTAATSPSDAAKAAANFKCPYDDKDVCKFVANFRAYDKMSIVTTSTKKDGTKSTITTDIDGKNSHFVATTPAGVWDTIQIGGTTYTKATDGTWWQQYTLGGDDDTPSLSDTFKSSTSEFTSDSELSTTTYTKVGTEKCSDLTCLKYKVIDTKEPGDTTYVLFDTKDFMIRTLESSSAEKGTGTMTFTYKGVKVDTPSPVKQLQANQYLAPGSSEPVTLPGAQ